jgi:hypothetical protein
MSAHDAERPPAVPAGIVPVRLAGRVVAKSAAGAYYCVARSQLEANQALQATVGQGERSQVHAVLVPDVRRGQGLNSPGESGDSVPREESSRGTRARGAPTGTTKPLGRRRGLDSS